MTKKNGRPLNASLRLERAPARGSLFGIRIGNPEQMKGALALAIEECLGESYAPMYWIYGPNGAVPGGEWPITGVCPVVWAFAGVLYTQFPRWIRDEMIPYATRIAKSESTPARRAERVRTLGRFAITESFRLWAFGPVQKKEKGLLEVYEKDTYESYALYRDVLNSIEGPREGVPLLTTLGSIHHVEGGHLCALRNSILDVGRIPAMVAEEGAGREDFLGAWGRSLETLNLILE